MTASRQLPVALRLVALIFLLSGIGSVITILVSLAHNRLQLDFGVLGIGVYFGLHRLSSGWRTCALVLTWIGIFFIPVIAGVSLMGTHANINIFGIQGPAIPPVCVFLMAIFWFCLAWWQIRVLNRPDIAALFVSRNSYTDSDR